jgi:pheromone shutdown-related protein TraB
MRFRNLIIIGTSHISAESIKKVEKTIAEERPGVVALELDRKRLFALLHPEKQGLRFRDVKRVGFKGWLFSVVGAWVERRLGEQVGVSPGSEMLHAVRSAQNVGAKLSLIDQDIEVTLRRFSRALTAREKWRLLADMLKGVVFRKREFKFDLSKVPEKKLIDKMIRQVRKHYPNVYKVLVEERNRVMAHRLAHIVLERPDEKIVAVVGAGHEDEILRLVKKEIKQGLNCKSSSANL